ncbi:hypothetical protein ZIOFF_017877 [Zingiber officinale]|uniref:GOLD domain-containing protein n=1 Tax=Zingiber officinale TaxID=94328 RepID=A0A8J5LII5_ZINOF|nr:hypothetical protein ZIOFF_017877 [Zingiber officinale]
MLIHFQPNECIDQPCDWFSYEKREFLFGLSKTNESTRKRLTFYTIMEYIVLALASGLQVLYIRRLFNKSVAYNRV